MIKFENTEVMNFEGALRGMRNPLNSWDKSDSHECVESCDECENFINCNTNFEPYFKKFWEGGPVDCDFAIGKNDMALAQKLIKAGSDHRKFLRQIFVSVDITAPLYWWKEFDTYKVGTVANSCSTMHTIHKRDLTLDDFSHEHLFDGVERCDGGENEYYENPTTALSYIIGCINFYRKKFVETKDKKYWWQIIQLLPSSYNQKRTITLNYEVLRNIRHSDRRNHKQDEWRVGFIEWIDFLPYAKELLIN